MEGTVREFFADVLMGTISGRNGRKYSFTHAEWLNDDVTPLPGLRVVFLPNLYRAEKIYVRARHRKGRSGRHRHGA